MGIESSRNSPTPRVHEGSPERHLHRCNEMRQTLIIALNTV